MDTTPECILSSDCTKTNAIEIVPDGGIIKILLHPSPSSTSDVTWTRGTNARLHYVVCAYVDPTTNSNRGHSDCTHSVHSQDTACSRDSSRQTDRNAVLAAKAEMFQKLLASSSSVHSRGVHSHKASSTDRHKKTPTNIPSAAVTDSTASKDTQDTAQTPPVARLSWNANSTFTSTEGALPINNPDSPNIQSSLSKPVRQKICDSRDHTEAGDPFELRIGYSFSVRAIELCVKSMRPGERARFLCMPEYCEGFVQLETVQRQEKLNRINSARGLPIVKSGGSCCAHATAETMEANKDLMSIYGSPLEFEIDLVEVQLPNSFLREAWEMTPIEKYREAPICKNAGADLYKRSNYVDALAKYERALVLLESLSTSSVVTDMKRDLVDRSRKPPHFAKVQPISPTEDSSTDSHEINLDILASLTQSCRLNYAACKLKLGDFPAVIIQCTEVLVHDSCCIKALFRRAQAYTRLGRDLDLAEKDLLTLEAILKKDPVQYTARCAEWIEYTKERAHLDEKLRLYSIKEKQMYGKLFT
ncbi:hypothetical protein BASA50_003108 [Batrachochytrium salamandrivorans]|uniref:PPIase FKBP-type domain-containing protein n=1 Tax=Batrachochytrium salamandrivorans TaxID=1357716 RepID=A0ABQ8FJF4_9FUNG|nr:hypothetical protein BASA61_008341 [Batrachochytrium salamandrivorans]KAH6599320.1 hypothetical protein BASA50_003108 [Batrachochytrium salamandrivorans]KAH9252527.1 hypothetical protein BASA81_009570 [Batrachochytrium salamandrivorans]KAH9270968.1 hypothetical protein BASA83_006924 [Batrachochytrium salamandrivorans]